MRIRILALSLAVVPVLPAVATSQTVVSADAVYASSYVWRGVTMNNASVLQPKLLIARSGSAGTATFFAAGNVEPSSASTADAIRQGGANTGLTELDLVAQLSKTAFGSTVNVGWIGYRFNSHNSVITNDLNTHELFAGVKLDHLPLAPSITAYQDVAKVRGTYVEGSLGIAPKLHGIPTALTATAGYAAGQERQDAEDGYFNFAKSGFTHIDLGVTSTVRFLGLAVAPQAHLQFNPVGQNTRVTGGLPANADRAQKAWIGVDIGWSR